MVFVPHHKAPNPTVMVAFSTTDPRRCVKKYCQFDKERGKGSHSMTCSVSQRTNLMEALHQHNSQKQLGDASTLPDVLVSMAVVLYGSPHTLFTAHSLTEKPKPDIFVRSVLTATFRVCLAWCKKRGCWKTPGLWREGKLVLVLVHFCGLLLQHHFPSCRWALEQMPLYCLHFY